MATESTLVTPVKSRSSAQYIHRAAKAAVASKATYSPLQSNYQKRPIVVASRAIQATGTEVLETVQIAKPETHSPEAEAALAKVYHPRRKLALLLPGHNEELIITETIRTAVVAGQKKRDIFVVDDNSDDATRQLAVEALGEDHVLTVGRSGKALAVQKAIKHFNIERDYQWLHIADADSVFSSNYFQVYRSKLDPKKYAVAVGFVQSLRGNWISTYRAFSYTYSQHVNRRVQSWLGMISVFPGPITCFRTDILKDLDISGGTIAEDFDITLQVHRKKLGKIVFIPKAINYTQDPQTLKDFIKQTQRWQRGFWQVVRRYHVGLHFQRLDLGLGFQMLQTVIFMIQLALMIPLIVLVTHNWLSIPVAIAADFTLNSALAIGSSIVAKRWNLIGCLPYFYFLRWVELCIYFSAFVEIMILQKFREEVKGWATEGRRYKLSAAALADATAK